MLHCKMGDLKHIVRALRLPDVMRLDLSFPLPRKSLKSCHIPCVLPKVLGMVLPNLQEVNLSGVSSDLSSGVTALFKSCPRLKTFHFNDMYGHWFHISGDCISKAVCLKDLQLDRNEFYFGSVEPFEPLFGADGSLQVSLPFLAACNSHLERVSLIAPKVNNNQAVVEAVPEIAIMLLVRLTPTLKWFRSSLSAPNIATLRAERPEVRFVNEHDEEWT